MWCLFSGCSFFPSAAKQREDLVVAGGVGSCTDVETSWLILAKCILLRDMTTYSWLARNIYSYKNQVPWRRHINKTHWVEPRCWCHIRRHHFWRLAFTVFLPDTRKCHWIGLNWKLCYPVSAVLTTAVSLLVYGLECTWRWSGSSGVIIRSQKGGEDSIKTAADLPILIRGHNNLVGVFLQGGVKYFICWKSTTGDELRRHNNTIGLALYWSWRTRFCTLNN